LTALFCPSTEPARTLDSRKIGSVFMSACMLYPVLNGILRGNC
jgi:hypothetical protein